MRKMLIVFSAMIFIIANVGLSQDIINETGKDGKFIVRDNEQQEALIIEDGNVEITGELSVESMPEGSVSNPYVVWDPADKKFKTVKRVFSKLSPLSKPLLTEAGQNVIRGNASDEYVSISESVLDIQAIDVYNEIRLRNPYSTDGIYGTAHVSYRGSSGAEYGWMGDGGNASDNMMLFATTGNSILRSYASGKSVILWDNTGEVVTVTGGKVGIGTVTPDEKLHVAGNMRLNGAFEDKDGQKGTSGQILSSTGTQTNWIAAPSGDGHSLDAADGSPVDVVFVNNAGNVGVGTTSPTDKLHVLGNIRTNTGYGNKFYHTNGKYTQAYAVGNDWHVMNFAAGEMRFGTNTVIKSAYHRMVIQNDGDVGIGTINPSHLLHVTGSDSAGAVGHFVNTVTGQDDYGIYGACDNTDGYGHGGYFEGGYMGVQGYVNPNRTFHLYYYGLYGLADTGSNEGWGSNHGVSGNAYDGYRNYGVYGYANGGTGTITNYGVYGSASGTGINYAGYFLGNVTVTGTLSNGSGSFKIDHPLDAENKYLSHSFVESPDMMNIYNGNVVTNPNGEAFVEMPDYFEPLNKEFRYQLTCIGGWAPLYIAEKMSGNRFKIAGGEAGMEVSWQVTGIRQDAFANANRIQVEEDKPIHERGLYLHPEAYGKPYSMSVDYKAEEEAEMQRMEELNRINDERRAQEEKVYQEQKEMSAVSTKIPSQ